MLIIHLIFFIVGIVHLADCQKIGVTSAIGLGCWNCAQSYISSFGCNETLTGACRCHSPQFMGTVVACIYNHAHDTDEITEASLFVRNFCKYNGDIDISGDDIKRIYLNASTNLTSPASRRNSMQTVRPIKVDQTTFQSQYKAAKVAKHQYCFGSLFGIALLGYWGFILLCATVMNLLRFKFSRRLDKMTSPWVDSMRKYLTLPATINEKHGVPLRILNMFTISAPVRGQSIIILVYVILNVLAGSLFYNINHPIRRETMLRYVGIRTGIISFTQLPLMMLFACRNNPFIYITGWPYHTFNLYHHWVGRMVAIHALVHGVSLTVMAVMDKSLALRWQSVINWRFGNMALFVCLLSVLLSGRTFRVHVYEAFSFIHKIVFIIFLVGIYRHCLDFGWMPWVNLTLVFYGYERFGRIVRILWTGVPCKATFTSPDGDIIRCKIKVSGRWDIKPGQFCYVRVLDKSLFWQNHPFTIYQPVGNEIEGQKNIQMAIKPKKGATKRLARQIADHPAKIFTDVPVLIEGPYGYRQPIYKYNTVFFLAGGIGITAVYSYIAEMIKNPNPNQIVCFIWVVPDPSALEWFGSEILNIINNSKIRLLIYTTRALFSPLYNQESTTSSESLRHVEDEESIFIFSEKDYKERHKQIQNINVSQTFPSRMIMRKYSHIFYDERPDIKQKVQEYISASNGTLGILSCGPPAFIDNIRSSIVTNIHESPSRIDYFEEAFSW